ncbi:hypothetical protein Tco_0841710 [Tanacetum coccineum]|uniref:Uncharacterized protein n=1 Tax=Tanacetum coccineum TaxID=301880 RepID=A0ABQ5B110_9ASTR
MIEVINKESSVTPLPFSKKKKKKKTQTVTKTQSKSQSPEASTALPQKRKKHMSKTTSLVQAIVTPPSEKVPTKDSDKTQPGTRKSKPLLESKLTDPQDSKGNKQPADMGLPAINPDDDSKDELKDDSGDDVFEVGEEMDEDIQQAYKEETQSLEPSKEQSTKILTKELVSQEHQSPSPHKEQALDSKSSSHSETFRPFDNYMTITKRQLEKHEEADASYADLKDVVAEFDVEADKNRNNYDTVINSVMADSVLKALMLKMAKTNTATSGNITGLTELLRSAKFLELIKEPECNQRLLRAAEGYIQNSTRLTEIANSLKAIKFPRLQARITTIENTQVTMQADISSIKGMVMEMFQTFKGLSSSTSSEPEVENVEKEPEVANEEVHVQESQVSELILITIVRPLTKPAPELEIIRYSSRLQLTYTILEVQIPQPKPHHTSLKPDIWKGIARDTDESP